MEFTGYESGTFCWADLATADTEKAKAFYGGLFHWETRDMEIGEGAHYHIAQLDGKDVAAMYTLSDEQKAQNIPPHWQSYISVASADDAARKAESLGGTVLAGAFDVFDAGRMAVIQDPAGATFSVWQAGEHIGARIANIPDTLCWNELYTNDTEKSAEFYESLFGWTGQAQEMEGPAYTVFANGDRMAGGMMEIQKEWGPVPPHWLVYFAVDDCNAATENVRSNGGQVHSGPRDIPEVGRFSILADPQRAAFAVIELVNPPS